MRGPTASFWLASLIVSVAMVVALLTTATDSGDVPRIVSVIEPAWWVAFFFGGGPHSGVTGEWWYIVPVTFVLALAMWWAVLEGCRRFWNLRRR